LVTIPSNYRFIISPLMDYILKLEEENPGRKVAVLLPELVVRHWWENLLHNQSALRLKSRLLFEPGVMVTSVPYQLDSSERRAGLIEDRYRPGDVRRGTGPIPRGIEPAAPTDTPAAPTDTPEPREPVA
jgi:hypothetical protein